MSDLDSFFAKKEKRRRQKGFNRATAENLGKQISDNIERQERNEKEREQEKINAASTLTSQQRRDIDSLASGDGTPTAVEVAKAADSQGGVADTDAVHPQIAPISSLASSAAATDDDDGWIIVDQQEKAKDLMVDLKIGEMSLGDPVIDLSSTDDENGGGNSKDSSFDDQLCNESGEASDAKPGDKLDRKLGRRKGAAVAGGNPWRIETPPSSDTRDGSPVSEAATAPATSTAAASTAYVPPGMRRRAAANASGTSQQDVRFYDPTKPVSSGSLVRSRRAAPDISNEAMFPSLGAEAPTGDETAFEDVRSRYRAPQQQQQSSNVYVPPPKMTSTASCENKFSALRRT